jgi:predicted CopG family antitoxin
MVRQPSKRKPTKNPMDSKMPTIRIMNHVKDELFEIAEKGETYSEVIQRLIDYYKVTKGSK